MEFSPEELEVAKEKEQKKEQIDILASVAVLKRRIAYPFMV